MAEKKAAVQAEKPVEDVGTEAVQAEKPKIGRAHV